ncbi:hypothetical protein F5878DRAFT_607682 [Lentinula raphanica]|uniref:Uncharacterized protein n=1 Tax=Lentinula raphanica TaxID=153919 RepID=A0AA38PGG5_9AGAR|nr:hypothetical protein F5880DRAFT_1249443 [Lentinula raphanica]KAJ3842449.1 hypothetical protein F5878DRAFT_607682 [Lentinula raphanica]
MHLTHPTTLCLWYIFSCAISVPLVHSVPLSNTKREVGSTDTGSTKHWAQLEPRGLPLNFQIPESESTSTPPSTQQLAESSQRQSSPPSDVPSPNHSRPQRSSSSDSLSELSRSGRPLYRDANPPPRNHQPSQPRLPPIPPPVNTHSRNSSSDRSSSSFARSRPSFDLSETPSDPNSPLPRVESSHPPVSDRIRSETPSPEPLQALQVFFPPYVEGAPTGHTRFASHAVAMFVSTSGDSLYYQHRREFRFRNEYSSFETNMIHFKLVDFHSNQPCYPGCDGTAFCVNINQTTSYFGQLHHNATVPEEFLTLEDMRLYEFPRPSSTRQNRHEA